MGMSIDKCRTCKHSFTTGKDRLYCKKSLADKDDCGEYEMTMMPRYISADKYYEAKLKTDMIAMLTELQLEIEEMKSYESPDGQD